MDVRIFTNLSTACFGGMLFGWGTFKSRFESLDTMDTDSHLKILAQLEVWLLCRVSPSMLTLWYYIRQIADENRKYHIDTLAPVAQANLLSNSEFWIMSCESLFWEQIVVSTLQAGCFFGSLFSYYVADRWGRRVMTSIGIHKGQFTDNL